MAGTSVVAWWAEGGSERCPHCLQRYAYEVQVRCIDCDGPLCPLCAVVIRTVTPASHRLGSARRCPDCHCDEAAGGAAGES